MRQIIAIAFIDQELHGERNGVKMGVEDRQEVGCEQENTALARKRTELAELRTSRATMRTLLANERTFLAWCRTSLGVITFGFVLEKAALFLKHLAPDIDPEIMMDIGYLSLFILVCGVALIITAAVRFFAAEKRIGKRRGVLNPTPEVFVLIAVAVVLSISFFYGRTLGL